MMEIKCHVTDSHNTLFMRNGHVNVVVVPNDLIDVFIQALGQHLSSNGDGQSFTLDFETGEVRLE